MEKLKELDNQQLAIATAVAIGALGLVGIVVGNNVVGIIMLVLQLGIAYVAISSIKGKKSSGNKNDKYRKLFMNLPIGFAQAKIITDHAGAVVGYQMVDANEKFGTYFNLDQPDYQDKILGESNIEVLQDINAWFSAYNNSGTREGDLMDVEITMEKLGKTFNTVMYKSEADHINMVVIDVTEQKETEAKLSKAIDDANAAYKTQAEFLANMSHEIRTPINGILGMIQLTLMAEDLQADYRDNLITAKNCADNLLRLINDILDISKLEAGKYKIKEEICDIKAAIEETVAAHYPAADNKAISLDLNFGNNIPKLVRADGQRIQQVLNCLLSNAIKFTSEGGVRVKIAALDDTADTVKLRIAVADTGIGISEANMTKLFIRFSQVDGSDTRKYGGSGLGLVISKQITELMNGTITVQSKEGIGSTFIAEIPLKIVKAAEVEEKKDEEKVTKTVRDALGRKDLKVELTKLKDRKTAAMLTVDEQTRRYAEMMKMYASSGMGGMDMGNMLKEGQTLVLNASHPLVQYVMNHESGSSTKLICQQLFDLAQLQNAPLEPEEMAKFVERSNEVLEVLTKDGGENVTTGGQASESTSKNAPEDTPEDKTDGASAAKTEEK